MPWLLHEHQLLPAAKGGCHSNQQMPSERTPGTDAVLGPQSRWNTQWPESASPTSPAAPHVERPCSGQCRGCGVSAGSAGSVQGDRATPDAVWTHTPADRTGP